MNFNPTKFVGKLILGAAASACCFSCIGVDNHLGESLLPTNQQYDIHTIEFYIDEIETKHTDSLSAYSSTRITVGAVRDDDFGLSTRSSALTLVPVVDTLDFGQNPVFKQFHFSALKDTTSFPTPDQKNIIQNINVYELETALNTKDNYYVCDDVTYIPKRITKGVPVYYGGDSLSFDFTKEFGEKYMKILQSDMDSLSHYTKKFPGIYITCDEPMGNGGRVNMFKLGLEVNSDYGYLESDFAELKFTSSYNGVKKDTSFLFYFSPAEFQNLDSLISSNGTINQFCFNKSTYESKKSLAGDVIKLEGGSGLKPVIKAAELRRKAIAEISKFGDPSKAVVSKASLILPYVDPQDEVLMAKYPDVLSPTVKIVTDNSASYANLTDASISDENQGDINRSLCIYSPDITHHMQEIINRDESSTKYSNFDIWLLTMAYEVTTTKTSGNSDMSEFYRQMAYNQYYNSMYGGYGGYGYGGYGYGGYGGYGYDNYSSYYTLMMMAQYAGSGSTSTQKEKALDKDRYYNATLVGPTANTDNRPKVKITIAIPKE